VLQTCLGKDGVTASTGASASLKDVVVELVLKRHFSNTADVIATLNPTDTEVHCDQPSRTFKAAGSPQALITCHRPKDDPEVRVVVLNVEGDVAVTPEIILLPLGRRPVLPCTETPPVNTRLDPQTSYVFACGTIKIVYKGRGIENGLEYCDVRAERVKDGTALGEPRLYVRRNGKFKVPAPDGQEYEVYVNSEFCDVKACRGECR
jgi:hypothetical protein